MNFYSSKSMTFYWDHLLKIMDSNLPHCSVAVGRYVAFNYPVS